KYRPSRLAAACLSLAQSLNGYSAWSDNLQFYSGYTASEVHSLVSVIRPILRQVQGTARKSYDKYAGRSRGYLSRKVVKLL
ncbi:hypothetical protein KIPB_010368, partial [Kipferlia bialata]